MRTLVRLSVPMVAVPVAVSEAMERLPEKRPLPCTERSEDGVVVPIPTKPAFVTRKLVPVEEPIANAGAEPRLLAWIERRAHGEVEAIPMRVPEKFVGTEVEVDVAVIVPKMVLAMFNWLFAVALGNTALYPIPMLFEPVVIAVPPVFAVVPRRMFCYPVLTSYPA